MLQIALVIIIAVGLFFLFVWNLHVRKVRELFVKDEQGTKKYLGGSNNPPFWDYILYGFDGRNIKMPFGDFELSFPLGFPTVMVSDPIIIKELLKGRATKDYDKGEMTLAGVEVIAGRNNLFSSDGDIWHHQRLIIDPAFRPNLMKHLVGCVCASAVSFVSKWVDFQPPKDIVSSISDLTLEMICCAAFGIANDDGGIISKSYTALMNGVMYRMLGLGRITGSDKKIEFAKNQIESFSKKGNPDVLVFVQHFIHTSFFSTSKKSSEQPFWHFVSY